jgi:hypothetical protein
MSDNNLIIIRSGNNNNKPTVERTLSVHSPHTLSILGICQYYVTNMMLKILMYSNTFSWE